MKKEKPIIIHLLGEFLIENKAFQFPNKVKKSTQLITLIAYLIMNRHTSMTKEALIDVLWPNGISENPEGALRNLIYRARKELEPFCKDNKQSCILSKGNTYSWNDELPWDIDVVHLEEECARIAQLQSASGMAEQLQELLNTYGRNFLHDFQDDWILQKREYYQEMIQCILLRGCTLCTQEKDVTSVLKICEYAEFKHILFPELMEEKLRALYQLKQYAQAVSYYHKLVDLYTGQFNFEITPQIREIYQALLKFHKEEPETIEDLMEDLKEEVKGKGAYYCDMDIFRNLYQMNLRASQRVVVSYLIMLRLKVVSKAKDGNIRKANEILKDIMYHNLRRCDVFAHCSFLSYGAILQVRDKDNCQKAMERIKELFETSSVDENIHLLCDIKKIA